MSFRIFPSKLFALIIGLAFSLPHVPTAVAKTRYTDLTPLYRSMKKSMGTHNRVYAVTYVALCSNTLIVCGNKKLGNGGSLRENLYWGTSDGLAKQLNSHRPWKKLGIITPRGGTILAISLHKRSLVNAGMWKKLKVSTGELYHLTIAIHGDKIGEATLFAAQTASHARLPLAVLNKLKGLSGAGGITAKTPFHVTGYVGHNYLMDKPALLSGSSRGTVPVATRAMWVTACRSYQYFKKFLARAKVTPLLMTRTLMYPGGFLARALLDGIATGRTQRAIVNSLSHAYYENQKANGTGKKGARSVFWPL
ncbi:hypothetical protein KKF84_02695 [Myxococcota bacterium]|nr:hypothetical protein [Myxococcota bacterium]MBU1534198.1 hypothetical protein [Myxococcota bacterium]